MSSVQDESKQPADGPPADTPQVEGEQTEKRKVGGQPGNQNTLKHGLNRNLKRTRAVVQDSFDRQGRYEATKLFEKADTRRRTYSATLAAWLRLKARLDARGWCLPSGEAKNAVTIWKDLGATLEKMRSERTREETPEEPTGPIIFETRFENEKVGLRRGDPTKHPSEDWHNEYCVGCGALCTVEGPSVQGQFEAPKAKHPLDLPVRHQDPGQSAAILEAQPEPEVKPSPPAEPTPERKGNGDSDLLRSNWALGLDADGFDPDQEEN